MSDARKVAYCGLVCTDCPAYIATRTGDTELLRKTAERWSAPGSKVDPDDILCDGCLSTGRRTTFCTMCKVRACARGRHVRNCAGCVEYPCSLLEAHWQFMKAVDEAKPVLDDIRRGREEK